MIGQPPLTTAAVGQSPVGEDLRHVRLGLRWSIEFVAAEVQISVRHLGQIESGIRTPNGEQLAELGKLYGIDLNQLQQRVWAERVPTRLDTESDTSSQRLVPGGTEHDGNEGLLRSIGATLRSMRSIGAESPVYPRSPEYSLLASRLDLDDPKLGLHLMQHLRLAWTESCELIEGLRQVGASPLLGGGGTAAPTSCEEGPSAKLSSSTDPERRRLPAALHLG